jgi:PPIC-type PPIASE domain
MSTPMPLPTAAPRDLPRTAKRLRLPAWTHEPLLHFVLLGALLFAIDHAIVGGREDPRVIVMSAEVDNEARTLFKSARGREPNADELKALRQTWLDNEVLYREGLALQVDKGDSAIRERVIFKALSVVNANLAPPAIDDAALRRWFEQRRVKYDEPARYDFQEAVLSSDSSEAAVRAFVETLNKGTPGELSAGLRVFKGRPHDNIVQGYGDDFARALEASAPGEWRAHRTRDGWRAMRLDAVSPPKPASFEALRGVVLQDWTDATMSEQRTSAVRVLAKKYTLQLEGAGR